MHEHDRQTDRQTDGQTDTGRQQRPRLRIASSGKKIQPREDEYIIYTIVYRKKYTLHIMLMYPYILIYKVECPYATFVSE